MDFMKKMEEKVFEKFDYELSCKKQIELQVAQYLEEKFNLIKNDLQKESKNRYDSIENLEFYFEVILFNSRKNYQRFKKASKWSKMREKRMIITIL